jgi:hypothetical protein
MHIFIHTHYLYLNIQIYISKSIYTDDIDDEDQDNDHFAPFNVDLSTGSSGVTVLQCYLIGERG